MHSYLVTQSGRRSRRQMVAVKVFIDAEQKVQTDFFLRIVYEECCNLTTKYLYPLISPLKFSTVEVGKWRVTNAKNQ